MSPGVSSPADRLREAADLLDRLDQAARPGPWVAVLDTPSPAVAAPVDECTCRASGRDDWPHEAGCGHVLVCYPDGARARGDARLIAALRHLAGPVSAWLRDEAAAIESRSWWLPDDARNSYPKAFAVADAILGQASGDTTKDTKEETCG